MGYGCDLCLDGDFDCLFRALDGWFKWSCADQAAFDDIPIIGPTILTIGLATFVFSTILGWSYYGEKAVEYLWGQDAVKPYRYLWVVAVFIGSVMSLPMVWNFADCANALMAIPNLISLIVLNGVIVQETRKYFKK